LRGFDAAAGDGLFPAQVAGEEHGVGEAEAGGSGDEDGRQLERAVGRDKAPEAEGHAVLVTCGGDDAEHHAVVVEQEAGSETEGDSTGKGDEADGEVVGHDAAGGHGLDADDGVGPHFVAFHGGDHGGSDVVAHELRTRGGDGCAEQAPGHGEQDRSKDVADLLLEDGRIVVAEEAQEGAEIRLPAGIDDMVGASQQLIHMQGITAGCGVLAENGEVGGDLAVEQGHLLQFGTG